MIRFSMSLRRTTDYALGLMKRFVSHAVHADASVLGRQPIRELDTALMLPKSKHFRGHAHLTFGSPLS
jgi:hypothetical protein